MSAANAKPADLSENQFAQINSVLDDLDILEEIEEVTGDISAAVGEGEIIEEQEAASEDDLEDLQLLSDVVEDMKREAMRKEAYENQESSTPSPDMSAVQTTEDGSKVVKKAGGKSKSKTAQPKSPRQSAPRAPRDISSVSDDLFRLDVSDNPDRARVLAMKPTQKKIAEKFENLFIGLHTGNRISTFTIDAYKLLQQKGSMTSSELVAAYKADGYEDGTARAQCGQIMNLFNTLRIAKRDGNRLDLNKNSFLAQQLDDWIAKNAAPATP